MKWKVSPHKAIELVPACVTKTIYQDKLIAVGHRGHHVRLDSRKLFYGQIDVVVGSENSSTTPNTPGGQVLVNIQFTHR